MKYQKIMIDKKKLIKELLDCVADATDTETQITSLTMEGMLMNEVLDEALTILDDVGQSEQYCDCKYEPSCRRQDNKLLCNTCDKEVR